MSALTFTECENSLNSAKYFLKQYYETFETISDYDRSHFQVIFDSTRQINSLLQSIYVKDIKNIAVRKELFEEQNLKED